MVSARLLCVRRARVQRSQREEWRRRRLSATLAQEHGASGSGRARAHKHLGGGARRRTDPRVTTMRQQCARINIRPAQPVRIFRRPSSAPILALGGANRQVGAGATCARPQPTTTITTLAPDRSAPKHTRDATQRNTAHTQQSPHTFRF